ncbi:ATP-dependent DNA ligase [Streptomyces virginiae]
MGGGFPSTPVPESANPRASAFDLLQHDGHELLTRPYAERCALLENLFSEHALTAPWTLCPQTTDLAEAREWLESWTDVSGVEGSQSSQVKRLFLVSGRTVHRYQPMDPGRAEPP